MEAIFHDPIELNSKLGRYTNFMNLLDLCGCAVPAFREDGHRLASSLPHLSRLGSVNGLKNHRTAATGAGLELKFEPEPLCDSLKGND